MTIDQDMRGDHAPEMLVAADRAPVEVRRILKKMLDAEFRRDSTPSQRQGGLRH